MPVDRRRSTADIPRWLPETEVPEAQASALFGPVLERIQVAGFGEARKEAPAPLARIMTALWAFVRDDAARLDGLERADLTAWVESKLAEIVIETRDADEGVIVVDRDGEDIVLRAVRMKAVRSVDVGSVLIRAYADKADDEASRHEVLNKASKIRRSMGDVPEGDDRTVIEPSALRTATGRDFWLSAFEQACKTDSLMVASLLLARRTDAFSEDAKRDREELWAHLAAAPAGRSTAEDEAPPVDEGGGPTPPRRVFLVGASGLAMAAAGGAIVYMGRRRRFFLRQESVEVQVLSLDGVELRLLRIPAGSFRMGSPASDKEAQDHERPQREVTFAEPFWMAETPVTRGAWAAVMSSHPSPLDGREFPVARVSFDDAVDFCAEVNAAVPELGLRLPTEEEWEYACRAGTKSPRYGAVEAVAWFDGNSKGTAQPVAQKRPNPWGLHDTLGNVWEWCASAYEPPAKPGRVWSKGRTEKVYRGGSWDGAKQFARAAARGHGDALQRHAGIGFRLCRGPARRPA